MTVKKRRWRAAVGITLPDGKHVPAGKLLPESYTPPKWLIEQGKVTR